MGEAVQYQHSCDQMSQTLPLDLTKIHGTVQPRMQMNEMKAFILWIFFAETLQDCELGFNKIIVTLPRELCEQKYDVLNGCSPHCSAIVTHVSLWYRYRL